MPDRSALLERLQPGPLGTPPFLLRNSIGRHSGGVLPVLFVSGPSGAGKSTTARAWADVQTVPTACIDVDALRFLVRSGRARPDIGWNDEAAVQWESACRIAASAAAIHCNNGARVVIEVFAPPAPAGTPGLPAWDELLTGLDVVVVHLMPDVETCLRHNSERAGEARLDPAAIRKNHNAYAWCIDATQPANVIDTTGMSVKRVVEALDAVLARERFD